MAAYFVQKLGEENILWLNLDETTVPMTPPPPVGAIVDPAQWQGCPARPHVKVSQRTRRIAFTYCDVICSDSLIQPKLPHFLLVTKKAISEKLFKAYAALPATQLQLLRRESAWMTSECLETILRALQSALEPCLKHRKAVLMLDCAMSHVTKAVMATAVASNIQLLFVPSGTTSILQPLDVFAYSSFKAWVRRSFQQQREDAGGEQVQALAWLWQLSQAPRFFFSAHKWDTAFRGVGVHGVQHIHSGLAQLMQQPTSLPAAAKPTPAELSLIWPQRRRMQYAFSLLFPC